MAGILGLHPSPKTRFLLKISCLNPHHSSLSPSPHSLDLNKTLSKIQNSGIIACLRAPSAELALGAAHAALDNGISVVIQELVRQHPTKTIGVICSSFRLSTFKSFNIFSFVMPPLQNLPSSCHNGSLGDFVPRTIFKFLFSFLQIGTILNVEDAKRAIQSGAKFLMSPAMVQDVYDNVIGTEVLYIPGVMTPTEILCAQNAGAKIVKVYPVSAIGGAHYIKALRKPFPRIPIVASQGITVESAPEYIFGGASAVVLSDAIFDKNAVSQGDFKTISKHASRATLLVNEAMKQSRLTKED